MPTDQFQTFLSFNNPDLAKFICEKLEANGVECIYNNTKPILDKTFVDTSIDQNIHIKLKAQDFPRAHEILNDYYSTQLDTVDEDYYLFSFSKEELKEIIAKPDEWGHFDYQLAKKILNDRNTGIDEKTVNNLKEQRISQLAKPEKASDFLIFCGYFLNVVSLIGVFYGDYLILLGLIAGFFIGRHLYNDQRTLPNGEVIYTYMEADRRHGNRIIIMGFFASLAGLVFLIWRVFLNSH